MRTTVPGVRSALTKLSSRWRVGHGDGQAEIVDAAGKRRALDHQLDIGVGGEDRLEEPDNQLGMADRKTTHDPSIIGLRARAVTSPRKNSGPQPL